MTPQQQLESAVALHQAGQFADAENLYRKLLQQQPNHLPAMILLGTLCVQANRPDAGIELLRRAIRQEPRYPDAHYNLAIALQAKGQLDDAIASFRHAIRLRPDFPDAHANLGIALKDRGQLDDAIAAFRHAIQLKPDYAEAHYNLGLPLHAKKQFPNAIASYRRAIQLKPDFALAHSNLGNALSETGRLDEAIASYRAAIHFKPDYADAHYNLGIALQRQGQFDQAVAEHRQAISLRPNYPQGHNNLGNVLKAIGQLDEAIAAYRHAIALDPNFAEAHSNLLLTLSYHPDYTTEMIHAELLRWSRRAQSSAPPAKPRPPRPPTRRLRIGYVSPDFCNHVVGRNILPLLSRHDKTEFEIFCYAAVAHPDKMTDEFRRCSDTWRDITALSDTQAADLIEADEIDILVDLALHTAGNRLGIFAKKPALVQITFAGYPGSTGLSTIDYRLSDPYLDPPGRPDTFYSEKTHRLPDTFWCYDPLTADVPINAPPAQANALVTFGCLNNFCKINAAVLNLWADVLSALPHSRLLMMAPQGSPQQRVLNHFANRGIAHERIEFVAKQSRSEYLRTYNRIDIGLDTLPYNGHTTSLDSLWMGVPVITLIGQTITARAGLSQLSNLALPELIATTPEQFTSIAAALAQDLPRLSHLRQTLRPRMQSSPLMNAARFAQGIETAYQTIWETRRGK